MAHVHIRITNVSVMSRVYVYKQISMRAPRDVVFAPGAHECKYAEPTTTHICETYGLRAGGVGALSWHPGLHTAGRHKNLA